MPEIGSTWVAVAPSARGFGNNLNKQVQSEVKSAGIGKRLAGTMGDAAKVAFAAVGTAAVAGFATIVKSGVKLNAALGDYQARFTTLTGSAEGARQAMQAMENVKLVSGQQKTDLLGFTQTLLGAGVSADQLEDRLRRLTKAGMDNTQNMQYLVQQYANVRNGAGLTQAQMVALQSRGFNPLRIAATQLARETESVEDAMERLTREFPGTEGNARLFAKAMELATEEGGKFYNVLEDMQNTMAGSSRNMRNAWENFTQHFTGSIDGPLTGGIASFNNAIANSLKRVIEMTKESEGLTRLWEFVASGIRAAGAAIGTAIERVAAGFYGLLDRVNFDAVADGLGNLTGLLVPLAGIMGGALGAIGKYMGPLAPLFKAIKGPVGIVIALFTQMWQRSGALREAVGALMGAFARAFEAIAPLLETASFAIELLATAAGDLLGSALTSIVIPALDMLVGLITPLIPIINQVVNAFTRFALTGELTSAGLQNILGSIVDLARGLLDVALGALQTVLGKIVTLAPQLLDAAITLFMSLVDAVLEVLPDLLDTLTEVLFRVIDAVLDMLPDLLDAGIDLFMKLVEAVIEVLPRLLNTLTSQVLPRVLTVITEMMPRLLTTAINLFLSLVDAVLEVLPDLLDTLTEVLFRVINAVLDMLPDLLDAGIDLFMKLVEAVIEVLPRLLNPLTSQVLPRVLTVITEMMPRLLTTAINLFLSLVDAVLEVLPDLLDTLTEVLFRVIDAVLDMLPDLLDAGIDLFMKLVEAVIEVLPRLLNTLTSQVLPRVLTVITEMMPRLLTTAINLFLSLVTAVLEITPRLIRMIGGLIPQIVSTLLNGIGQLIRAGWDLLTGMLTGITNAVPQVLSFMRGMPGQILASLGSAASLLVDWGRGLVSGIIDGIRGAASAVGNAITSIIPGRSRSADVAPPAGHYQGISAFGGDYAPMKPFGRSIGPELFHNPIGDALANSAHQIAGQLSVGTLWDSITPDAAPGSAESAGGYVTRADLQQFAAEITTAMQLAANGIVTAKLRHGGTALAPLHA